MALKKGDRVRARWFKPNPNGTYSIAGCQSKVTATVHDVVGVVTHIRGDHPTSPTTIGVWIQPDDGSPEVGGLNIKSIVEVLPLCPPHGLSRT